MKKKEMEKHRIPRNAKFLKLQHLETGKIIYAEKDQWGTGDFIAEGRGRILQANIRKFYAVLKSYTADEREEWLKDKTPDNPKGMEIEKLIDIPKYKKCFCEQCLSEKRVPDIKTAYKSLPDDVKLKGTIFIDDFKMQYASVYIECVGALISDAEWIIKMSMKCIEETHIGRQN